MEESNSEWNNPIVLVPKPSGALRFCNDFRKLNQVSQFDSHPMPRVDELVENLAKSQYLTTLDLTFGYWQIPFLPLRKKQPSLFLRVYFGTKSHPLVYMELQQCFKEL